MAGPRPHRKSNPALDVPSPGRPHAAAAAMTVPTRVTTSGVMTEVTAIVATRFQRQGHRRSISH
jgi:hypothetical protein